MTDIFEPKTVSAIITASLVAGSEKIEKTSEIIDYWQDINGIIDHDNMIAGILVSGYYQVLKSGMVSPDDMKSILEEINSKLKEKKYDNTERACFSALVSSSLYLQDKGSGGINKLIEYMDNLYDELPEYDEVTALCTIMACGRIADSSMKVESMSVMDFVGGIEKYVRKVIEDSVQPADYGVAFLVNSFLLATSKVESFKDIGELFEMLRERIKIDDDINPVTALVLLSGRVSDFVATDLVSGLMNIPIILSGLVGYLKKSNAA